MAAFQEDGVTSISNETPMSILYKIMQQHGENVYFHKIYDDAVTPDHIYKYSFSAFGCTAIGEGKTMLEAKQDTAAALLKIIKIKDPDAKRVRIQPDSPRFGFFKEDFVRVLEKICVVNKLPMAGFKIISEHGPSDAKMFTTECKLSRCTEVAVAQNRTHARQKAAKQMINRVKDILGDKFAPVSDKIVYSDLPFEPYDLKRSKGGTYSHDMSIPLADAHNIFFSKKEELNIPEQFFDLCKKPVQYYYGLQFPVEFLETLIWKLGGTSSKIIDYKLDVKKSHRKKHPKPNNKSNSEPIQPVNIFKKTSNKYSFPLMKKVGRTSLLDKNLLENAKRTLLNYESSDKNVRLNSEESLQKCEECDDKKGEHCNFILFLTIACPVGKFIFISIGQNVETAEKQVAVDALEFFWVMALPKFSVKDPFRVNPLKFLWKPSSSSASSERVSYKLQ